MLLSDLNQEKILKSAQSDDPFIELVIKPDVRVFDENTEIMVSVWGYRYQDEMICMERHSGTIFITLHSI